MQREIKVLDMHGYKFISCKSHLSYYVPVIVTSFVPVKICAFSKKIEKYFVRILCFQRLFEVVNKLWFNRLNFIHGKVQLKKCELVLSFLMFSKLHDFFSVSCQDIDLHDKVNGKMFNGLSGPCYVTTKMWKYHVVSSIFVKLIKPLEIDNPTSLIFLSVDQDLWAKIKQRLR